jgi:hypothetical protein
MDVYLTHEELVLNRKPVTEPEVVIRRPLKPGRR